MCGWADGWLRREYASRSMKKQWEQDWERGTSGPLSPRLWSAMAGCGHAKPNREREEGKLGGKARAQSWRGGCCHLFPRPWEALAAGVRPVQKLNELASWGWLLGASVPVKRAKNECVGSGDAS